jgi:hypothetical protein
MRIMKRPNGTNICQKFCSASGKLLQCNSQDDIDFVSFVVSRASTGTSSEAGIGSTAAICSKDWACAKAGIGSDTGMPAARQQILTQPLLSNVFANKHVPMAANPHPIKEELLETVFSRRSVPKCCKQSNWSKQSVVKYYPGGNDVSTEAEYLHCQDPLSGNDL